MPEWHVLLLIFCARLLDVPIGTVRMMMVMSGHRLISAVLGFFEVMIWVVAVGKVIAYLDSPVALVAYGAGFAVGTLVGMHIEQRLAIGWRVIRVINPRPELLLAERLRRQGLHATRIDGHGGGGGLTREGPVEIVFLAVKRRLVPSIMERIARIAPDAFVSVERAEKVSGFTQLASVRSAEKPWRFGQLRK
ncbi:MAG: hypothetical protein KatS3mg103_1416 [Phycisphaerales bacterium]|nr:MAG: hypothetical protein KatS3mg103_1416 [Phycisphaerales bacterium]